MLSDSVSSGLVQPLVPREPDSLVLQANGATILDEDPGAFLFGAFKNMLVLVWRRQATAGALRRLSRVVDYMRTEYPQGRSSIHVVLEGAGAPTNEAQNVFVRLAAQAHLACVAAIFLGSGFWASALRSNSTGMTQKAGGNFKLKQHSSIEELGNWLPDEHFKRTGVRIRAENLCDVVRAFVETQNH